MQPSKTFFPFLLPTEFNAPDSTAASTYVIVEADVDTKLAGRNSIMLFPGAAEATAVWLKDGDGWNRRDIGKLPFEINYFNAEHREEQSRTREALAAHLPKDAADVLKDFFPLIAVVADGSQSRVYHYTDQNQRGSIFVKYADVDFAASDADGVLRVISDSADKLWVARRSINDACNHGRWRQDMELERKFTFVDIPDTWRLINAFYSHIIDGGFEGFVPEVGLEFQTFDYIVEIFDVLEPQDQKGYIAFIPQVNGKTCVKQKWFASNKELRKETLSFDVQLDRSEFEDHARSLCGGVVQRLPAYRRKRFDVNFESLRTGNVYGVFFDICRTVDAPIANWFSQCEVEYCRSRTFGELTEILDQYEHVCGLVENFFDAQNIQYSKDMYSKLDFGRDSLALQTHREPRFG